MCRRSNKAAVEVYILRCTGLGDLALSWIMCKVEGQGWLSG